MTIDDTTVAASRGEVRIDTDGTLWTRATAAWKQYPQTSYYKFVTNAFPHDSVSGIGTVRGMVYCSPFEIHQKQTINKVFLTTQAASGTVRMAIYQDNGLTPAGGAKVWDSGNVGSATPTAATASYIANPGLYWIAFTAATSAYGMYRTNTAISFSTMDLATFSYPSDLGGVGAANYTRSTALPVVCPAISSNITSRQFRFVMTVT